MSLFFDHQLALLNQSFTTKEEALQKLSEELRKKQCVTDDFYQNIIRREEIFPTGLAINGMGVAIPHTDSQYVNESQVAFMSLKKPLPFIEMGTNDKEIEVSLLFMLALKEPHEQLEMLQKLIEMFQKPGVLEELLTLTTETEYLAIIKKYGLH
ncbi:PTS system, galactitol-specific IIA component [Enterococcus sp. AZ062]